MEEGHEREMQQRETAHAQALRHKADLHAQKLRYREELYAKEREQAIQIRNIKEGEGPADDEPYFNVQNDIGGFDTLTREEFNDFRDKTKDRWSKVSIREPVDGGLVGGNDFREEDHVWTGSPGTGSGAVVPDQGFGDAGSTSEEDVQNSHSKMKRGKEKKKQQAQVSPRDYLEKDG